MYIFKLLILFIVLELISSNPFPKILWVYWENGFSDSDIVAQLCSKNHHHFLNNSGWEIRQLNSSSVKFWLEKVPDFNGFPKILSQEKDQVKTNLISLYILKEFGGVWIDPLTILVQNFSWLENLSTNPNIQNKIEGEQPKVFMFYLDNFDEQYIDEDNKKYILSPGLQKQLISVIPHSEFIKDLLEQYLIFITKGAKFKQSFLERQQIKIDKNHKSSTLSQSIQTLLQLKQKYYDKYSENSQRKIAVKEYGIWTMKTKVGPHLFHQQVEWDTNLLVRMIYSYSTRQLEGKKLLPKYLIELENDQYLTLKSLLQGRYLLGLLFDSMRNDSVGQVALNRIYCPQIEAIVKDSILDQYMLSIYPFYEIELINYFEKGECTPHWYLRLSMIGVPFLILFVFCLLCFIWIMQRVIAYKKN